MPQMLITPGRYFQRSYEKTIMGEIKQVSDLFHVKAIVGKGKLMGTVVSSHKAERSVAEIKTFEGAIEISKFDFEMALKELEA